MLFVLQRTVLKLNKFSKFNRFVGILLFISCFVPIPIVLHSQPLQSSSFPDRDELSQDIKISFFPTEPEYRVGDNMEFEVGILNTSLDKNFQFKFYNERYYQFKFVVYKDFQEYTVKKLTYYRFQALNNVYDQSSKIIAIAPKENFGFRVDIEEFFNFNQPGIYHIEGVFYPLGIGVSDYEITIQPFVFRVFPPNAKEKLRGINGFEVAKANNDISKNTGELIEHNYTSEMYQYSSAYGFRNGPDYVVRDHFNRIELSDYEGYIGNFDLAKLLVNSYNSTEEYQRFLGANSYEKSIILEDFKIFLIENLNYTLVENALVKTTIIKEQSEVEAVMAVREPYENFRRTVDPQTGTVKDSWISEPINRLNKYYHLTFGLENYPHPIQLSNPNFKQHRSGARWKIVRYDVRVISQEDYQNYLNGKEQESEALPTYAVERKGSGLVRTINFSVNEARVENEYLGELKSLAEFLIANPSLQLSLTGHTDEVGNDEYNLGLSSERVNEVANVLVAAGLDINRIKKTFKGEREPITPGLNEEQRRLNRRVEIEVFYPNP